MLSAQIVKKCFFFNLFLIIIVLSLLLISRVVVYSHASTVVMCPGCGTNISSPTGGKAKLTAGIRFRRKAY
jgi:hypothetical protein